MSSFQLKIHVVGAGLIGTSIALASKISDHVVTIEDIEPETESLARDLLNSSGERPSSPDVIFVAVSPKKVSEMVLQQLRLHPEAVVVDVASVKTKVVMDVESFPEFAGRFVASHPIAGREVSGPASAQADLFRGRAWIITPGPSVREESLSTIETLLKGFGAEVHRLSPERHDFLFARISHLPQLLSTLLAGSLVDIGTDALLSGQGLRDLTRLAGSSGDLWKEIISLNSAEILSALDDYRRQLEEFSSAISNGDVERILDFFQSGNQGRSIFSGKHGGVPRDYTVFHIVIEDKPGVLAELFALCGKYHVNVEDLSIEHSPNQETGLISLSISKEQTATLQDALGSSGWNFHLQGETK